MQGYFESCFKGQKKDIDRLLKFISDKSKENQMYEYILELINLPQNYNDLDSTYEIEMEINMRNNTSGNINFFQEDVYFNDVCKAVPELELKGYYELLDAYNNSYYSPAGTNTFIFEGDSDEDLIIAENDEICELCGRLFTIDIEEGIKQYTEDDIFINHLEGFADDLYDKYDIEYEDIELCETTIPKNESSDGNMLCINCYTENNEMYYPLCKICKKIDLIVKKDDKYFNFSNQEVMYESDDNYTCNNCRRE